MILELVDGWRNNLTPEVKNIGAETPDIIVI